VVVHPTCNRKVVGSNPTAGFFECNKFRLHNSNKKIEAPKTKIVRAEAFSYKHTDWLNEIPEATGKTVEALENPLIFQTPGVSLGALKVLGKPGDVLREIKEIIFAAS
jgi:hypothetical protein